MKLTKRQAVMMWNHLAESRRYWRGSVLMESTKYPRLHLSGPSLRGSYVASLLRAMADAIEGE